MSKVAMVWGAGGGIGRALVYRLREEGWRVPLWDKVPFKLPSGALSPDEAAERILGAYRDGQRGVLEF